MAAGFSVASLSARGTVIGEEERFGDFGLRIRTGPKECYWQAGAGSSEDGGAGPAASDDGGSGDAGSDSDGEQTVCDECSVLFGEQDKLYTALDGASWFENKATGQQLCGACYYARGGKRHLFGDEEDEDEESEEYQSESDSEMGSNLGSDVDPSSADEDF